MEAGSGKAACSNNEEEGQSSVTAAIENNETNRKDIRTNSGKDVGARGKDVGSRSGAKTHPMAEIQS